MGIADLRQSLNKSEDCERPLSDRRLCFQGSHAIVARSLAQKEDQQLETSVSQ
jgi:hypothetical protein